MTDKPTDLDEYLGKVRAHLDEYGDVLMSSGSFLTRLLAIIEAQREVVEAAKHMLPPAKCGRGTDLLMVRYEFQSGLQFQRASIETRALRDALAEHDARVKEVLSNET